MNTGLCIFSKNAEEIGWVFKFDTLKMKYALAQVELKGEMPEKVQVSSTTEASQGNAQENTIIDNFNSQMEPELQFRWHGKQDFDTGYIELLNNPKQVENGQKFIT